MLRSILRGSTATRALMAPQFVIQRGMAGKVDIKLVKSLREMTGAPMADCKKALVAAADEADVLDAAFNWLRKAGLWPDQMLSNTCMFSFSYIDPLAHSVPLQASRRWRKRPTGPPTRAWWPSP